jgi:aspartyl protease family protein
MQPRPRALLLKQLQALARPAAKGVRVVLVLQIVFLMGLGLFAASRAHAQAITLAGMLGGKPLVIIDGAAPKLIGVGETHRGVKVVSSQGEQAVFEIEGKRLTLQVGEAPASVTGKAPRVSSGTTISLAAGAGGHFATQGLINGKPVQLMVDTGATSVSLGVDDADRLGLPYKSGQPLRLSTANGVTQGWRVKLNSMRVGDVDVYDVDAVVTPAALPYVLLGNSFLTRFQMTRHNDQMLLVKRY